MWPGMQTSTTNPTIYVAPAQVPCDWTKIRQGAVVFQPMVSSDLERNVFRRKWQLVLWEMQVACCQTYLKNDWRNRLVIGKTAPQVHRKSMLEVAYCWIAKTVGKPDAYVSALGNTIPRKFCLMTTKICFNSRRWSRIQQQVG